MIISYIRALVLYLVLIGGVRLLGKRQIGQLAPSEFVVTMLLANLASIPMQDVAIPLWTGLVPLLTVLGAELALSGLMFVSVRFRRLLCGKPVILIDNGKLCQGNLRRTRVTLDELTAHLRESNVLDIRTVQYAILETDGVLSVFPYPKDRPASAKTAGLKPKAVYLPVTIIEDGCLSRENLHRAGRDEGWLQNILAEKRATAEGTYLLTVDASDQVVWVGKEEL